MNLTQTVREADRLVLISTRCCGRSPVAAGNGKLAGGGGRWGGWLAKRYLPPPLPASRPPSPLNGGGLQGPGCSCAGLQTADRPTVPTGRLRGQTRAVPGNQSDAEPVCPVHNAVRQNQEVSDPGLNSTSDWSRRSQAVMHEARELFVF